MYDWNRARWAWLKLVTADSNLGMAAKALASALVTQFSDKDTGHCAPGTETAAAALGTSTDTIKRAFKALAKAGYLTKTEGRGAGNRSIVVFHGAENVVQISAPKKPETLENRLSKGGTVAPFIITERSRKKGAVMRAKGGKDAPFYNKDDPNIFQSAHTENAAPVFNRPLVQIGRRSFNEEAWNEYLISGGWPNLNQLDKRHSDGWAVPFQAPPAANDVIGNRIAEKWANWAMSSQMERASA